NQPDPTWTKEPVLLVKEFICDYHRWNDNAYLKHENSDSEAVQKSIESEWQTILQKYCRPDFEGQPIAYGSESDHDLAREEFVSTEIEGGVATIRTRTKKADSDFIADYEYVLKHNEGRWLLEQVYYVDDEGKYPGL